MITPERILILNKNSYSASLQVLINVYNDILNTGTKKIKIVTSFIYAGAFAASDIDTYNAKIVYLMFSADFFPSAGAELPLASGRVEPFDENNNAIGRTYGMYPVYDTVGGVFRGVVPYLVLENMVVGKIAIAAYVDIYFRGLKIELE